MMTQLTTAPWSTLHVSHCLRRIVTFLIIAPYKYSYLLTCTASINRSRSGHEVMTHDVLFGRDKVDEYFNGTAVEYRVADPLQLFIYTQPLVRLPLDASDQFLYLQLLRSNVPTPHTVFHKNALGPTTTCWRGGGKAEVQFPQLSFFTLTTAQNNALNVITAAFKGCRSDQGNILVSFSTKTISVISGISRWGRGTDPNIGQGFKCLRLDLTMNGRRRRRRIPVLINMSDGGSLPPKNVYNRYFWSRRDLRPTTLYVA